MRHAQATTLIEVISGTVASALVCTWTAGMSMPPLIRTLIVFLSAKIAGDGSSLLVKGRETYYFEDFLVDTILYAILAVLAAGATAVAGRYIGGAVEPVYPAAAVHLVMTILPAHNKVKRGEDA